MSEGQRLAQAALQPGVAIGRYLIERRLGQGGMGVVFRAHDPTLRRPLAIKVLGTTADPDTLKQVLLREARTASALNHPNICTIYEVGEDAGWAFIAMEYIDGRPLCDLVDGRPLSTEDAVRHGIEAADALAHAHDRGVVHRDLKAANAIVSSGGRLKIVDFGLARRTDPQTTDATTQASIATPGVAAGTPYAMAPEQVRGGTTDARTDLWALGVLLYEMLAGARPFRGETVPELFASILRDPPVPMPPHVPVSLGEVVLTCLAKSPEDRYQRAADVRLMLEAAASRLRGGDMRLSQGAATGVSLPPSLLLDLDDGGHAFVGRASERAQMEQAWTRATGGQRQLLLLAGEPGIGKTRLAMEFARGRVESPATVLVGRCDEEALVPYQPFVEALSWYARVCPEGGLRAQLAAIGGGAELGPLVPELLRRVPDLPAPPAMNPEGRRFRLFEAFADLLAQASASQPILLVIEDLHWADRPTLLLLRHVMRASSAASLCIVGTYRESELVRTHPLAETLAEFRRASSVTRLSLRGLEEAQVKGMVDAFVGADASPQLARLVADSTEGNPFFIGETLRHLKETGVFARLHSGHGGSWGESGFGLPEGVKEVIGQRLSRLSDACGRMLGLASVIGREFEVGVLEAFADLPEDRLLDLIDEAVRARLVSETPGRAGRFSFAHALIRETLYGELTTTRRVRLHRRVGEAIERLSHDRPDPPLADLAYHFVQAASVEIADKAIDYATRAGDRAADALAYEEAARLYEMALQSLELKTAGSDVATRRADLHSRRATAFGAMGQWALQKLEIEQALGTLDPLHVERRCELLLELTAASFWLLDIAAVGRLSPEALELAEQVRRSDLAANAIAWLARARNAQGDLGASIELDRQAAARSGGVRSIAHAMQALSFYLAGRAAEGIAASVQAAEMARTSRDTTFTMNALSHHGLTLGSLGRYDEAAKVFDEVRQFGRRYGALPLLARATSMAAGFHLNVFDFEGAEALESEARELGRSAGFAPSVVSAGIDLLLAFARRHDPGAAAEKLLADTEAAAATTPGWHEWLWRLRLCQARAELALARGAFETAVVDASEGISQSRARGRPKYEAMGLVTRAQALHALGRTRDALADAAQGVVVARGTADPAVLLPALDAWLGLDGDDQSLAEARSLTDRIAGALPDDTMRRRFIESDVVGRVRRYA